jgi:hypothetical protein
MISILSSYPRLVFLLLPLPRFRISGHTFAVPRYFLAFAARSVLKGRFILHSDSLCFEISARAIPVGFAFGLTSLSLSRPASLSLSNPSFLSSSLSPFFPSVSPAFTFPSVAFAFSGQPPSLAHPFPLYLPPSLYNEPSCRSTLLEFIISFWDGCF